MALHKSLRRAERDQMLTRLLASLRRLDRFQRVIARHIQPSLGSKNWPLDGTSPTVRQQARPNCRNARPSAGHIARNCTRSAIMPCRAKTGRSPVTARKRRGATRQLRRQPQATASKATRPARRHTSTTQAPRRRRAAPPRSRNRAMLSMEESGRDRPQDRVTLPPGIGRETNTSRRRKPRHPRAPASSADHRRRDLTHEDHGDQHAEHGVRQQRQRSQESKNRLHRRPPDAST